MDPHFTPNEVYQLNSLTNDSLFVCLPTALNTMGKLLRFTKIGTDGSKALYKYSNISYFLNCYQKEDPKSFFLNRENYDIVGKLENNFLLQEKTDGLFLTRMIGVKNV